MLSDTQTVQNFGLYYIYINFKSLACFTDKNPFLAFLYLGWLTISMARGSHQRFNFFQFLNFFLSLVITAKKKQKTQRLFIFPSLYHTFSYQLLSFVTVLMEKIFFLLLLPKVSGQYLLFPQNS